MSDRKDVTFSMSWEDLSFLSYALGVHQRRDKGQGRNHPWLTWQVTFERALEDNFEENGGVRREQQVNLWVSPTALGAIGATVAQERRFPCPECGADFHFKADEPRISAPCAKCGKLLTMPHGKFDPEHLTMGVNFGGDDSGKVELVLGRSMGWSTPEEREKVTKTNAIYLIERWEEVRTFPYSSPDDIKKAGDAAMERDLAQNDIYPQRQEVYADLEQQKARAGRYGSQTEENREAGRRFWRV